MGVKGVFEKVVSACVVLLVRLCDLEVNSEMVDSCRDAIRLDIDGCEGAVRCSVVVLPGQCRRPMRKVASDMMRALRDIVDCAGDEPEWVSDESCRSLVGVHVRVGTSKPSRLGTKSQ